jgi:hypothetical protein
MKANELRIGNWITEFTTAHPNGKNIQLDWISRDDDFENCRAIPLTPEILEKCGFETPDGYIDTVKYKDGVMIDFNRGKYLLRENNRIEIKYLHQLQNLYFSLTGEELEVKL